MLALTYSPQWWLQVSVIDATPRVARPAAFFAEVGALQLPHDEIRVGRAEPSPKEETIPECSLVTSAALGPVL